MFFLGCNFLASLAMGLPLLSTNGATILVKRDHPTQLAHFGLHVIFRIVSIMLWNTQYHAAFLLAVSHGPIDSQGSRDSRHDAHSCFIYLISYPFGSFPMSPHSVVTFQASVHFFFSTVIIGYGVTTGMDGSGQGKDGHI